MPPTMLTLTPPDAEWMARAACAGYWDLMESTEEKDERAAKDVCAACPVWEACRAWTLSLPPRQDVAGVAGGLTEKQRDQARRRIRRRLPTAPEEPRACTRGKECVHGEVMQPASEFYRRPRYPAGRETQCRTCCQKKCRERKAAKKAAQAGQTTDVKGIAS